MQAHLPKPRAIAVELNGLAILLPLSDSIAVAGPVGAGARGAVAGGPAVPLTRLAAVGVVVFQLGLARLNENGSVAGAESFAV